MIKTKRVHKGAGFAKSKERKEAVENYSRLCSKCTSHRHTHIDILGREKKSLFKSGISTLIKANKFSE